MSEKRYCLRYAAGAYWLLDTQQSGRDYRPPVKLNEMGADIIKRLNEGISGSQLARAVAEEYQADSALVERDVRAFLQSLETQGIAMTEWKGTVRV